MKPENLKDIQSSFTVQTKIFANRNMSFSKQEYLDYTIRSMELQSSDLVLEAAAGTCACVRTVAPFVQSVVCLDATPAMLALGEEEAAKAELPTCSLLMVLWKKFHSQISISILSDAACVSPFYQEIEDGTDSCILLESDGLIVAFSIIIDDSLYGIMGTKRM